MELSTATDIIVAIVGVVAAMMAGGLILALGVRLFVTIADKIAGKYHEKKDLQQRIREHSEREKETIAKLAQQTGSLNIALEELRERTGALEERARELSIAYNMYQRSMTLEREERKKNMDKEKLYQYNVKFNVSNPEQKNSKEYFYFAFKEYEVGDVVIVDTVNGLSLARISSIASAIPDIPVDRIRTIVDWIDYDRWRDKLEDLRG